MKKRFLKTILFIPFLTGFFLFITISPILGVLAYILLNIEYHELMNMFFKKYVFRYDDWLKD